MAILGGIFAVAAFPTLFFNEGRAVKTAKALKEGAASVVPVKATEVDSANEGKFVHVSGTADTPETLADQEFGVSANAIRLIRNIEMYQWKEEQEEVSREGADGRSSRETEYSYKKVWSPTHIDSSKFNDSVNHANPAAFPFRGVTYEAKEVFVGEYRLPESLVQKISQPEQIVVDVSTVTELHGGSVRPLGGTPASATGFYWSTDSDATQDAPQIGDVRIQFSATYATDVSVMAQQAGTSFRPFETHSGRQLNMLSLGLHSPESMIEKAETENTVLTWGLRVLGSVLSMLGIGLILSPVAKMTDRIPVLGKLVGMGTALIAVVVGGALSLFTIGTAWLFYHPLIAIPLMAFGVALLWFALRSREGESDSRTATAPVPPPPPPPVPN